MAEANPYSGGLTSASNVKGTVWRPKNWEPQESAPRFWASATKSLCRDMLAAGWHVIDAAMQLRLQQMLDHASDAAAALKARRSTIGLGKTCGALVQPHHFQPEVLDRVAEEMTGRPRCRYLTVGRPQLPEMQNASKSHHVESAQNVV